MAYETLKQEAARKKKQKANLKKESANSARYKAAKKAGGGKVSASAQAKVRRPGATTATKPKAKPKKKTLRDKAKSRGGALANKSAAEMNKLGINLDQLSQINLHLFLRYIILDALVAIHVQGHFLKSSQKRFAPSVLKHRDSL